MSSSPSTQPQLNSQRKSPSPSAPPPNPPHPDPKSDRAFRQRMNQSRTGGHQAEPQQSNSNTSTPSHGTAPSPVFSRPSPGGASSSDNAFNSKRSAFAPYRDNTVLHTVSVPCSPAFPAKDTHIGPQHFTRLKLLGRGGIGQVFLVRLKGTDKLYAMKVLSREEMIQKNKVKRVMTEREILATANHPFIVTMYASFQTPDRLCFVMDYCAGGEFFRVLQRQPKRRLKEDAVRFYAAEVILALEYLHHMGFIYRDLKPENILMRATGHIALTDFDLSKRAHAVPPQVIQHQLSFTDKLRQSLTMRRTNSALNNFEIVSSEPVLPYQTNSFVGTEEYIAPEVVNGVGQSSAVDWWTLGILIYEMLTGTTPFKGTYTDETFKKIVNENVKWPDDINISNDCKQLVKKLLRRDATKRLGSQQGATEIMRSRWFKDFNFQLVRNETPPIMPKIRDPLDFSQYRRMPEEEDNSNATTSQASGPTSDDAAENPFRNFNMTRSESIQRQY
ncbi:Serine/threonine-protein kinase nrc-2 [Gracilariopsis chorda]|uniref:non-specific serine/threonine protein kinase n=1 Tax=Gracilariopsis chorda TaxID=448386 RepID=A0A2V3ITA1_9FLOR|nr:Serine/threonine-protein kinase nrc-2 [Gracilariopsis chorda]|eukprot:PXF45345.1 Serine/threonine-protein kinase nrc-2 [Gracilariopsis chorda]